MSRIQEPVQVFLAAAGAVRCAGDDDLDLTRQSLQEIPELVRLTSLDDCEVIHAVWVREVAALPVKHLEGRRVVCHADNAIPWLLRQPYIWQARERVGLWIAQNETARRELTAVGMANWLVPYSIDMQVFGQARPSLEERRAFRTRWGVPQEAFVLGNFMRDTQGDDLSKPKEQKGVEAFLAIARTLKERGIPIHVVLAGPRRHWLRARFVENGIPFTYVGDLVAGDDIHINILPKKTLWELYQTLDVYLLTSRWEAGSRVVLEAAAAECRILSTPVGISPDLLEPEAFFRTPDEAVEAIAREMREGHLSATVKVHSERVKRLHTPTANARRFAELYASIGRVPVHVTQPAGAADLGRNRRRGFASIPSWIQGRLTGRRRATPGLRISLWHEFQTPPYGGGNQFMLALQVALENLGAIVCSNRRSGDVDVHICNSAWFSTDLLAGNSETRRLRMLHRIDGPIALYRGTDRSSDDEVFSLNAWLASATVLQSFWSYSQCCEMGYQPVRPIVIRNAVNSRVFHPVGREQFRRNRRTRLIASSWSDNPRKGAAIYAWLDKHLDWERYEFTFVGRTQERFERIRHVPPQGSEALADLLRQHDIYITASQNDPCSNALLEGLACGLPALYFDSGGHPELVGQAGLAFQAPEEIPSLLDRLVVAYESFQEVISVPKLEDTATAYLRMAELLMQE